MKQAIKLGEVLEICFSKGEAKDFIENEIKSEWQKLWNAFHTGWHHMEE